MLFLINPKSQSQWNILGDVYVLARTANRDLAVATFEIYALIIIATSAPACVKPINAGVRVRMRMCCTRLRADGWERPTGNRSMRGERGSPMDVCKEAPRGLFRKGGESERGLSPPFKMATSHSFIGLDMTAPPRARSTTVLGSGFTPLWVTRMNRDWPHKPRTDFPCT